MVVAAPIEHIAADMAQSFASGSRAFNRPAVHCVIENPEGLMFLGSGGAKRKFFFEPPSGSLKLIVIVHPEQPPQTGAAAPAIADIQDTICRAFDLTMNDLAEVCHRTRKTLYNWREGTPPRPSAAQRLFMLYRAARDWRQAGYPSPGPRLRQPLLGDCSLYDVLHGKPIDLDAIDFIGSRLAIEAISERPLKDPFA